MENKIKEIEKLVNTKLPFNGPDGLYNHKNEVKLTFASTSEYPHDKYCGRNLTCTPNTDNSVEDYFDESNIVITDNKIEDDYELQFIDEHDSYTAYAYVDKNYNVKMICYSQD